MNITLPATGEREDEKHLLYKRSTRHRSLCFYSFTYLKAPPFRGNQKLLRPIIVALYTAIGRFPVSRTHNTHAISARTGALGDLAPDRYLVRPKHKVFFIAPRLIYCRLVRTQGWEGLVHWPRETDFSWLPSVSEGEV